MPPKIDFGRNLFGPTDKRGPSWGKDVRGYNRALTRAGYMKKKGEDTRDVYDAETQAGVKRLQKASGIQPRSGHTGQRTFEALRKSRKEDSTEWAFDDFAIELYDGADPLPTERDVKNKMVNYLFRMYRVRNSIRYDQLRAIYPIRWNIAIPENSRVLDCSGLAIYAYWLCNQFFRTQGIRIPSPDPHYGYTGYGNTWSLLKGGRRVSVVQADIGDLVHYPGHVAVVVARNPLRVISHGSESGPLYLPFNYRNVSEIRSYPLIT